MDLTTIVERTDQVVLTAEEMGTAEVAATEVQAEEAKAEEVTPETVETKAEEQVETPATEVKEEVKEAVTRTSFFDNGEKQEEVKAEPTAREKELETALAQAAERLKAYDESPVGVLAKAAAGEIDLRHVDIKALAKQIAGEDYSKYPLEELMRLDLKNEFPNLSDEKIALAVEDKMSKMEDWYKEGLQPKLAAKLASSHNPSEVLKTLQAVKADQIKATESSVRETVQQDVDRVLNDLTTSIDTLGTKALGQEMYGLTVTQDIITKMKDVLNQQVGDGTGEKVWMGLFNQVAAPLVAEASYNKGFEAGREAALREKGNPNQHKQTAGVTVSTGNKQGVKPGMKPQDFKNTK